ncbi:MAG: SMP-30/gluconolactonase/LRE family protein [Pirellulaceae bacterium]|nr:SMP-30/gluconolactonase/LRE family protein [Pirellulaceae bacterium]
MRGTLSLLSLLGLSLLGLSLLVHSVEAADPIPSIGPVGEVELVKGNFQFLEGPTRVPGGSLYFTDIPAETIYVLGPNGSIETFLKPSKRANGLMYAGQGKLLACQMEGQLVRIDLKSKEVEVLADKYQDKRFNACNDLVIDKQGGIYFTDPRFSAPNPWPQGAEAFYYRAPDGTVTRLGEDIAAPNGIILSPDETTLYVVPSMQRQVLAYAIKSPGKLGERKPFCELKQLADNSNAGGDGLTVDIAGNLYITTGLGIQVYAATGKLLGIIEVPEHPANVTFGGSDNKTLYITARKGLYRCQMEAVGHQFRTE